MIETSDSFMFTLFSSDCVLLVIPQETYHYFPGYIMIFQHTLGNCSTFLTSLYCEPEAFTELHPILISVDGLMYVHVNYTTCILYMT